MCVCVFVRDFCSARFPSSFLSNVVGRARCCHYFQLFSQFNILKWLFLVTIFFVSLSVRCSYFVIFVILLYTCLYSIWKNVPTHTHIHNFDWTYNFFCCCPVNLQYFLSIPISISISYARVVFQCSFDPFYALVKFKTNIKSASSCTVYIDRYSKMQTLQNLFETINFSCFTSCTICAHVAPVSTSFSIHIHWNWSLCIVLFEFVWWHGKFIFK